MSDPIHNFYCSKPYLELSLKLKIQSEGKCARCGKIYDISKLRTHHITELTLDNINDPHITLNPNNLEVICHDCHNKEHHRFCTTKNKKVYAIWGAPCSGKSEYVAQVATRYDLIIDLDRIHQSICSCSLYDKPDATKGIAFDIRDLLLDRIKYRAGKWDCAYIIGCYPQRQDRERLERELGAELIHMSAIREECIMRAMKDENRQAISQATIGYIENYFERFTE